MHVQLCTWVDTRERIERAICAMLKIRIRAASKRPSKRIENSVLDDVYAIFLVNATL